MAAVTIVETVTPLTVNPCEVINCCAWNYTSRLELNYMPCHENFQISTFKLVVYINIPPGSKMEAWF